MTSAASLSFVVADSDSGQRVDKLLTERYPECSRGTLQRWILLGNVLVDGQPTRAARKLRRGQRVEVTPATEPRTEASPDPSVEYDVLFEDSAVIVVNKPAGLVVHPAKGHWTGTLVNGLLARPGFEVAGDPDDEQGHLRPGIVHRLDKDTSGVMIVAKTPAAREELKRQIASREVGRRYEAICLGVPRVCTVDTLYGRHPTSRLRFSAKVREGKRAVTHLESVRALAGGVTAHIECRLETGRTHQIRVHLAETLGCPLLGDTLYASLPQSGGLAQAWRQMGHQALHAKSLTFRHPTSQEVCEFHAPTPPEFLRMLEQLSRGVGS